MRNESPTSAPILPTKFFIFGCSSAVSFSTVGYSPTAKRFFNLLSSSSFFFFPSPFFYSFQTLIFIFHLRISAMPIYFPHSFSFAWFFTRIFTRFRIISLFETDIICFVYGKDGNVKKWNFLFATPPTHSQLWGSGLGGVTSSRTHFILSFIHK